MAHKAEQDLLSDLTPAQRKAVTHFEGPLLILAGPGSGKTRVITRRVAWLLQQGVRPSNILAITFTNKAAGEMRQRVEVLVPGSRVWISTFHSFGARLLRQYADRLELDRNFTIYDQSDRARIVKMALEDAGIDNAKISPDTISAAISKAKNQLLSPDRFAERARDFYEKTVAGLYPIYEKRLRDANALDFDDLLYWPALALKHDKELRAELDARFRFVLIDEYQDTNQAQYAIARGLSVDNPNLCLVGDPDQSIYKFRGSDIRNILDFERDFPDARVLRLNTNYRSTKAILHAAGHLIAHNRQRKPMALVTDNPQGQPVTVLTFDTGVDEAEGIARRIREAVEAGKRSYRDFAVFLRVNALSRGLETAFVQHRVPHQIVRGLAFFERKENRDILAYLRLMVNPRDDLSFLRIVNEPARGIGKVSLDHLREYAAPREMSLLSAAGEVSKIKAVKGKAASGLRDFHELLTELRTHLEAQPDEVIRQVLDRSMSR
jgi:DNA helicase-2/ATP-dependent DNA helicase PcrA